MMAKKTIAIFILAAFCLFNWACLSALSFKTVKRTVKKSPAELGPITSGMKIVKIILETGESVEFQKDEPARISTPDNSVVGSVLQDIEIDKNDIEFSSKDRKGRITSIETVDGRAYKVLKAWDLKEKIRVSALSPIRVPLSDIQQVWIRKTDAGLTALYVVAVAGGTLALGALMLNAIAKKIENSVPEYDSCPFIYSFNGDVYVLDAEPFGAAASEGLKRTDWIEMTNLREVKGKYRVLLTNELDETQYTDELKLVAVDHAPEIKIAPDPAGRIHTFDAPLGPVSATDDHGRDILPFVGQNDQVFWLSDLEDRNPDGGGEFRDELVLEFHKPAGMTKAKLLVNAWTTQWGALSSGKFLELYGASLPEQYEDVDRHGPTYHRFMNWMVREELYALKIWVETPDGWKVRGMIMEGAPVVTKDKAYIIDVADVPGEVLRIKLRPPVNFWMINSLAVDYGEDSPVRLTEIAADTAIDQDGRDVRAELAATDGNYLESPKPGERAELVFTAPPVEEGLVRTVLVKASGYYKRHLNATGEPRTELIERVLGEPGFAARYSFREYLNWAAGLHSNRAAAKR